MCMVGAHEFRSICVVVVVVIAVAPILCAWMLLLKPFKFGAIRLIFCSHLDFVCVLFFSRYFWNMAFFVFPFFIFLI